MYIYIYFVRLCIYLLDNEKKFIENFRLVDAFFHSLHTLTLVLMVVYVLQMDHSFSSIFYRFHYFPFYRVRFSAAAIKFFFLPPVYSLSFGDVDWLCVCTHQGEDRKEFYILYGWQLCAAFDVVLRSSQACRWSESKWILFTNCSAIFVKKKNASSGKKSNWFFSSFAFSSFETLTRDFNVHFVSRTLTLIIS